MTTITLGENGVKAFDELKIRLNEADISGDGTLTLTEWKKAGFSEATFNMLKNDENLMGSKEFLELMGQYDLNKDGAFSETEMLFFRADKNFDFVVTRAEDQNGNIFGENHLDLGRYDLHNDGLDQEEQSMYLADLERADPADLAYLVNSSADPSKFKVAQEIPHLTGEEIIAVGEAYEQLHQDLLDFGYPASSGEVVGLREKMMEIHAYLQKDHPTKAQLFMQGVQAQASGYAAYPEHSPWIQAIDTALSSSTSAGDREQA